MLCLQNNVQVMLYCMELSVFNDTPKKRYQETIRNGSDRGRLVSDRVGVTFLNKPPNKRRMNVCFLSWQAGFGGKLPRSN